MNDIKYLHAFNTIRGVGQATMRILKERFPTLEEAWRADEEALRRSGIRDEALKAILWKRASINPDREMEQLIRARVWILTEEDEKYPALLKEIPNPPAALYGIGNFSEPCVGVVGTRKPTLYGLEATEKIVHDLTHAGITIVSGLATGIDTRAHNATLESKGKTIAVLGSGVDTPSIFPQENVNLTRRIAESGGAVISEYPIGTPALKEHFPQRNRIISGLSRGIVVVEAQERSGALITARFALEQNREVFAVPGSIFSMHSRGPHGLIKEGARIVTSGHDILEELGIEYSTREALQESSLMGQNEYALLEFLTEPHTVDELKELSGIEMGSILSSLSLLELHGMVKKISDDSYQKI